MRDGWLPLDREAAGPAGILVDDQHAVMTRAQLAALMEYSTTTPTGVVPGKQWKRREPWKAPADPVAWWLGEYFTTVADDGRCGIHWRRILLVD